MNLPPDPRQAPNPFEPPPVGSYYGGPPARGPVPPASTEAVAALVCAIMAWACFPLGFVALWLGLRARRAVRENPAQVGGDQLALLAVILGSIFGALGLMVLLLYAGLIMFAVGAHVLTK